MLIELKHITKIYNDTLLANDDVSFGLNKGELLAVVGENGAGKSTIMKILYGLEQPNSGEILMDGQPVHFRSSLDAMHHGIGMLQQHFMLFPSMTVAENIVYHNEIRKNRIFFDTAKAIEKVRELSAQYGLEVDPEAIVSTCPVGVQQRVEIMKILYQNADIIIFDEPSAVLTPLEVKELLKTLRKLVDEGKSIILITHKLQEVMEVADRVVVMRQGKVVGEKMKKDTSIEELSTMMIGRNLKKQEIKEVDNRGECLKVEHLTKLAPGGKKLLDDINIHISFGEIVGVAGVSGNGQNELVDCLFGMEKPDSGSIMIGGEELSGREVADFREHSIALIPEDRYMTGSAKTATLAENSFMGSQNNTELAGKNVIKWKMIYEYTQGMVENFNVACQSPDQTIGELSGGNAQKFIVAREMTRNTKFIIAHEPTRGIDIGAIEYIHSKLLERRNEGAAVLLISSELTEIMELSDRIYVIHNGRINGEFIRGSIDEVDLGIRMLGGK